MSKHYLEHRIRNTAVAAVAILLSAASAAKAADAVTIAAAGGAYQDALRAAEFEPAAEKLGITINEDTTNNMLSEVRVQVKGGLIQNNIQELSIDQCAIGVREGGLFEELDYNVIDKTGFPPEWAQPTYIANNVYSYVMAWNKNTYGENGPKSWSEFWDAEKFPGRRSLLNSASQTMEAALLADGVDPANLYPLDVDRAIASLNKIKPHIAVWWTSGAQSAQLLRDGEVDLIAIWNGRVSTLMKEGTPVDFTYDQGIMLATCFVLPKGQPADEKELAMKVLAEISSPEILANLPAHIDYGPANSLAYETGKISPEMMATLNTSPENLAKQVPMNAEWWAEHGPQAEEKWNNFMTE